MAENKKPFNIPYQGVNPYLDDNISELNSPGSFKDGLTLSYIIDSTEYGGASEGVIETYQLNNVALQKSTTLKNGRQVIQERIGFSLPNEYSFRPNFENYSAGAPVPFEYPASFITNNIFMVAAGPGNPPRYEIVDGALRVEHLSDYAWNTGFYLDNKLDDQTDWQITVEFRNINCVPYVAPADMWNFAGVGVAQESQHTQLSGFYFAEPGLRIYGPGGGTYDIPGFETFPGGDTGPCAMRIIFNGSSDRMMYRQYKAPGQSTFTTYHTSGPYTIQISNARPVMSMVVDETSGGSVEVSKFEIIAGFKPGEEPILVPSLGGGWSDFVARGREFWIPKNNNFNADVNRKYLVDTSSSVIECIVLSSNLELGDSIEIKDYADTFDINSCNISFDGIPFEGDSAGEFILDWKGAAVELVYTGTDIGWKRVKE